MGSTNVNVGSIVPGIGLLNLGKLEDVAHIAGGAGIIGLTRRADTAASGASLTGNTSGLITDSTGKLWVNNAAPVDSVTLLPEVGVSAIPSGGYTKKRLTPLAVPLAIRGGGQAKLGGFFIHNTNAALAFIQLFDAALVGDIIVGTTVPNAVFVVPVSGQYTFPISETGINFALGAFVAATTTATGSTALGAALESSWFYK